MFGTIPEAAVWAILFLPLASLATIVIVQPRAHAALAGGIAALFIGGAFALSLWALDTSVQSQGTGLEFPDHEWLTVAGLQIDVGLHLDGLTAIMLVVVTSVSFLVQVYSIGYMKGDSGVWRYFAYMSLFTASMLGLILVDSLLVLYVFWELVGVSSFLLIGFWFHRSAAAAAAKKAFLVTRLGDLGLLGAVLLVYVEAGSFNIEAIHDLALAGAIGGTTLTFFALGIFAGAAGKSAQVPFHVWLPDAMESPMPVSALIHAATMVAAGVYLVARMFPVFSASPDALEVVGAVGGVTAISAAFLGVVQTDIKRVLAYSTISQLGYMMLALGIGAYFAAIFHLLTHAFFKALLFLGAGSVNHASGTFDMRLMGGLRRSMPVTFVTFLAGSLSLAGVFPLAGFWSKDEILSDAWAHERYLFWIGLTTAGLTALYMFRAIFLTFMGQYRGGASEDEHQAIVASVPETSASTDATVGAPRDAPLHAATEDDVASHQESTRPLQSDPPSPLAERGPGGEVAHRPHESPWIMALPLIVLMVAAVLAGFANADSSVVGALGLDKEVEHILLGSLPSEVHVPETEFQLRVAIMSTLGAGAGIFLAWLVYGLHVVSSSTLARLFGPLHRLLENRYYIDALYERVIAGFVFYRVIGGALAAVDGFVVDGAVNALAGAARTVANGLRYVQSGQFQTYGALAFGGLAFTAVLVLALSPI